MFLGEKKRPESSEWKDFYRGVSIINKKSPANTLIHPGESLEVNSYRKRGKRVGGEEEEEREGEEKGAEVGEGERRGKKEEVVT